MGERTEDIMRPTPAEMADELSMSGGNYLLVEGKTDQTFWKHMQSEGLADRKIRLANKRECSGNKAYVMKVIVLLNERKHTSNVIGIVDLDYDYVLDRKCDVDNLYYYRYIDLENVLIQSSAFSEVNDIISSEHKKKDDDTLRDKLYEKTYILGLLRLLSTRDSYNFDFENIDYKKLKSYEEKEFLNYFMSRAQLNKTQREEIEAKICKLAEERPDPKYVCNGHDILEMLSLMTRKDIANEQPIEHTAKIIGEMMITSYRKAEGEADIRECRNELLLQ